MTFEVIRNADPISIAGANPADFPNLFSEGKRKAILNDNSFFLVGLMEGKVVGLAKIFMSPESNNIHLCFLESAASFKHRGIGRQMVEKLFALGAESGRTITTDGFTKEGRSWLLRVIEQEAHKRGPASYAAIPSF